ncbi:hypothetical protein MYCTH_96398 [Thermothelomyces thermophilus ATCC 42464]|uniref:Uncharacterized protein n=1 Tax=Thermothelomyces thermophilus (strain ATCC 42464 / BCRC 31852 / DSM 1799) TaxID=573729 RepID=G2QNN0_THET4|nr:uncharacterized protein MYCTH_96398 [Thermothelomyces thermophilus ATCC 42464]AEO62103.1 hypothetical protein MYCTH_96398 [Thermothelomyces thermophilus ATCC 42464]
MVQNGGDFDLDIDMATDVTAEQLLTQLGQLQQRVQELDQRDKAAQARIKELENREKYSQKLEIAAIDETTKDVIEVAATSYEDKGSDTDSLGHDGNGEDEQAPNSELVTMDPETGLAEWDMAGEYAPPASILPALGQWGFTQSDEMKDEMRELRRIVETIKGEQPVIYDRPDSYTKHLDGQQLSNNVQNPEYQFMRANRGKDKPLEYLRSTYNGKDSRKNSNTFQATPRDYTRDTRHMHKCPGSSVWHTNADITSATNSKTITGRPDRKTGTETYAL